jgi:hypothetical protein
MAKGLNTAAGVVGVLPQVLLLLLVQHLLPLLGLLLLVLMPPIKVQ